MTALLQIEDLRLSFAHGGKRAQVLNGASMDIARGETVALVGESGSGKSVTALSVLQLLPQARYEGGKIIWQGESDLLRAKKSVLRKLRGGRIAIIFQEPMTALNPLHRIGRQIAEAIEIHQTMPQSAVRARVAELLRLVGMEDVARFAASFPHELSGGQRQRVLIAMALANNPDLLIADEPTTALDVTVQEQILALLRELQQKIGMALLLITHDLNMAKRMAKRVYIMQNGRMVESGEVAKIFAAPQHDYTKKLIGSAPKGDPVAKNDNAPVLLRAENLRVWFPIKKGVFKRTAGYVKAVDGIDFSLRAGQTLGIVGESGSGKTTLGLALLRLVSSQGLIEWDGKNISPYNNAKMRPLRRDMQIVFQDPFAALSPRLSVTQIVGEGLDVHFPNLSAAERDDKIASSLRAVGLDPSAMERYPHEFSGGQRQRIAIARALVLRPRLVILDEPTSALDMTTQAQIVDLLRDLQRQNNLSYIVISHDLRVVKALSHDIVVMRSGRAVEKGTAEKIFASPQQDYTKALLRAAFME